MPAQKGELAIQPTFLRAGAISLLISILVTFCGIAVTWGTIQERVNAMDMRGTNAELRDLREINEHLLTIEKTVSKLDSKVDALQPRPWLK